MTLILEIAAGVILGGIGLEGLRWAMRWASLAPWRKRVKRLDKPPMTDLQYLGIVAVVVALCALAVAYALGAFK